jgi:hypothetical protein
MPRRKVRVSNNPPPVESFAVRERYGLQKGDEVRFQTVDGGNYTTATVSGESKDGSLSLWDGRLSRSIMPERVQRKKRGPRGGTIWEDLV